MVSHIAISTAFSQNYVFLYITKTSINPDFCHMSLVGAIHFKVRFCASKKDEIGKVGGHIHNMP